MINWTNRKYINPRKRVFKNMQTNEILNLEIQDDLTNIETESETPLNAEMLNLAQQELKQDILKEVNEEIENATEILEQKIIDEKITISTYTVENQIIGDTEFEIPIYYKVGFNTLDMIYNGELLKRNNNKEHYYEVGELGSISNKIKLGSDWNVNVGERFIFIAKGIYNIPIKVNYMNKSTQMKEEIPNSRNDKIMYFNYNDIGSNGLTVFCDVGDVIISITKDGTMIPWNNGMVLEDGIYEINVQKYNGICIKNFVIDTKSPKISGIKGDYYERAITVKLEDIDDTKIATIKKLDEDKTIDLKEQPNFQYRVNDNGEYRIYLEDYYENIYSSTFTINI